MFLSPASVSTNENSFLFSSLSKLVSLFCSTFFSSERFPNKKKIDLLPLGENLLFFFELPCFPVLPCNKKGVKKRNQNVLPYKITRINLYTHTHNKHVCCFDFIHVRWRESFRRENYHRLQESRVLRSSERERTEEGTNSDFVFFFSLFFVRLNLLSLASDGRKRVGRGSAKL